MPGKAGNSSTDAFVNCAVCGKTPQHSGRRLEMLQNHILNHKYIIIRLSNCFYIKEIQVTLEFSQYTFGRL